MEWTTQEQEAIQQTIAKLRAVDHDRQDSLIRQAQQAIRSRMDDAVDLVNQKLHRFPEWEREKRQNRSNAILAECEHETAKLQIVIDAITADRQAAKADRDAKIAAIPKPKRPACHPTLAHPEGKWNGQYYGNDKRGHSYYVNNIEYKLSAAEYQQCVDYRKALDAYQTTIKQL